MALDVTVPDPPSLSGPQPRDDYDGIDAPEEEPEDDYRREEIAEVLADGAWADGFEEWTTQTGLTETEFDVIREHGLLAGLDFYWDPASGEVGYRAPTLSAAARGAIDRADADEIDSELDTLGRVVSETLENDYLVRNEETFGFFADEADEASFDYDDEAS
ncbi:hypothetical protein ACFQL1_13210 [Halomicroarcula sp. GCM10025709]|uniref:hypothetical protein n=1 Tax=Haloarcula TaxID=2237 RepID=UPI0024C2DCCC|nr:hypothetical protein [Halomicroarcula sp. YJ-61-S]